MNKSKLKICFYKGNDTYNRTKLIISILQNDKTLLLIGQNICVTVLENHMLVIKYVVIMNEP